MTLTERWSHLKIEPKRWVAGLAATLVMFQLGLRGWAGYHGYFYLDDFAFTSRATQYGLSPGAFLFRSYNSHLMPGAFVEVWTLTKLWPMDYVPVVTLALFLQVVLGLLFYRLLATLFGPRAAILIPFAIFTMSPISLPAFLWWAASLNQLPQQIATVAALLCHVQYLRSGRVRRGVLGVVAVAGGLLFSEKTLLALPLVAGFTLAFAAGGSPWSRVRRTWLDHRQVWLAYLTLVVPYAVYYLLAVPSPGRGTATGGDLFSLGSTAVVEGILPGLLGGPWTWNPVGAGGLAAPGSVAAFLSAAVIVVFIVVTVAWNRASSGAWIIAVGFVVVDIALLGVTRATVFGAIIGTEYRYFTDCVMVIGLAVGLSTLPITDSFARGSVQRLQTRDWAGRGSRRAAEVRTAVWLPNGVSCILALIVAVGVSGTVSTVSYERYWRANPARPFFTELRAELAASEGHVVLFDQAVPSEVVLNLLYPYTELSRLTPTWTRRPRYLSAGHPSAALAVVDDTGHLRQSEVRGVTNRPGPGKACGYLIRMSSVPIPLMGTSFPGPGVLRMGYIANGAGVLIIRVGSSTQSLPVTKGLHSAYLIVPGGISTIAIASSQPGLSVCTDEITVGFPFAIPGTSVR